MKITKDNLDQSILDKLDKIDQLYEDLSKLNKEDFLSFDGTKFQGQKINDLNLRKMTSLNEIENLKSHLYKETAVIKNSIETNFNMNNRAVSNFRTQVVKLKGMDILESLNEIRMFKKGEDNLLVLDRAGNFFSYNISSNSINYELNLAEKIQSIFAIPNFLPYDILDFQIFRDGFLFSTSHNGVFYADIKNNSIEIIFPDEWVISITVIDEDDVMFISKDGSFSIYNFDKKLKIETFNKLKALNQTIKKVQVGKNKKYNRVYILAQNEATNWTKNIIHVFERDKADLGYNDVTAWVYPGYNVSNAIVSNLSINPANVIVTGIRNSHLFSWIYSKEAMNNKFTEVVFDHLEFDKVNFVKLEDDTIFIDYKNRLLGIGLDGNIKYNLELNRREITDIIFNDDGSFYAITGKNIVFYSLPTYSATDTEFTVKLYEGHATNNIEIFVKSSTGDQLVSLVNPETLEEIQPNYHIIYNNDSYIKVTGKTIKELIMKIRITPNTEIESIVVNANRIFLK